MRYHTVATVFHYLFAFLAVFNGAWCIALLSVGRIASAVALFGGLLMALYYAEDTRRHAEMSRDDK